jgi:hypothetical protein
MRVTMHKWISIGLCAVLFLSFNLAPRSSRADSGGEDDRPIRLYATATAGPIGWIVNSNFGSGTLTINGHEASGGQSIWSGDLVQCSAGSRASVSLDSIGQITLSRGTAVRLATRHITSDDGAKGFTVIASLAQGEIAVRLEHRANAYLRVAGAEYASSEGATFLAGVREGRASIDVKSGEVRAESQASQHQYSIRPVGHGSNIKVPAGGLRRLQVQVLEDDKPVPGVGVAFTLDTSGAIIGLLGMGTLSGTTANVVTGADGIAAVQFVARNMSGSSPISATIEGSRVSWTGQITVTSKGVSRGTGWTIFALIAAGAAGGVAYALTREKDPLEAQPPVVKNP